MTLSAPLYDSHGKESGTIALSDVFFGREVNTGIIHRLLLLQHANARLALAHTKTRGERRGSTRKLYRQKGTGNARSGASRSPVRKKGGVVFGPRNDRNYSLGMNKKERRVALFSLLSSKAKDTSVKVIEAVDANKAKDFVQIFSNMNVKTGVFALTPADLTLFRAVRNLPHVKAIGINYLNPHDLLKYSDLIFTKESLEALAAHYASSK